jgi:predicted ATP-dependent endonuclease of OLD family
MIEFRKKILERSGEIRKVIERNHEEMVKALNEKINASIKRQDEDYMAEMQYLNETGEHTALNRMIQNNIEEMLRDRQTVENENTTKL